MIATGILESEPELELESELEPELELELLATEVAFCRGATCSVRHQYQPNIGLLHHPPGTPVRGQFLLYIRALRATLNKTDRSFISVSLLIS